MSGRLIGESKVDGVPTKITLKSAVDNHVFVAGLMKKKIKLFKVESSHNPLIPLRQRV